MNQMPPDEHWLKRVERFADSLSRLGTEGMKAGCMLLVGLLALLVGGCLLMAALG